jgi:hypothetical protein
MLDAKGILVKNLCESHYCSGDKKELTDDDYRDFRIEDFINTCLPYQGKTGEFGMILKDISMIEWTDIVIEAREWSSYAHDKMWDREPDDFHTRFVTESEWVEVQNKGDDPRGSCDELIYVVWNPDTGEVRKIRHDIPFWIDDTPDPIPEKSIYIMRTNDVVSGEDGEQRQYKIGIAKDVEQRRKGIQSSNANEIEIIFEQETIEHNFVESLCHEYFAPFRGRGEWFTMNEKIMDDFVKYAEIERRRGASFWDIINQAKRRTMHFKVTRGYKENLPPWEREF